jgi:hypothetical protein
MINPTSIFAKIGNIFGNIEQFNLNLIASVTLVETTLGPGTASANLEAVKAAFVVFNADIDAAKAFIGAFEAPFAALVGLVSQLKSLAANITTANAVQPAPGAGKLS